MCTFTHSHQIMAATLIRDKLPFAYCARLIFRVPAELLLLAIVAFAVAAFVDGFAICAILKGERKATTGPPHTGLQDSVHRSIGAAGIPVHCKQQATTYHRSSSGKRGASNNKKQQQNQKHPQSFSGMQPVAVGRCKPSKRPTPRPAAAWLSRGERDHGQRARRMKCKEFFPLKRYLHAALLLIHSLTRSEGATARLCVCECVLSASNRAI